MVDRLTDLMQREAASLDVPTPRHREVLREGRRLRRRRGAVTAAAGAAAVLVVAGAVGAGTALLGDGSPETAGDPAGDTGATFSIGTTVYLDGGADEAAIDDRAIKSLYYTSAGVVVRHGNNPWSDGGGPQRFSVVAPDGGVRPLDLVTEGAVQATDPDQPYLAWATRDGGAVTLHVWDVETDTEAAAVVVPGAARANDGTATAIDFFPVALDGDTAYVGAGFTTFAVDWRTGESEVSPLLAGGAPVAGGRAVVPGTEDRSAVRDLATGETLLEVEIAGYGYLDLSPDGRFAAAVVEEARPGVEATSFDVYDVATGEVVTVAGQPFDYGWSADGDLFRVDGDEVTTCSASTGACDATAFDGPAPVDAEDVPTSCITRDQASGEVVECGPGLGQPEDYSQELKLGGRDYES